MFLTHQLKTQNPNKVKLVATSVGVALLLAVAFLFFNRPQIPVYNISLSPAEMKEPLFVWLR